MCVLFLWLRVDKPSLTLLWTVENRRMKALWVTPHSTHQRKVSGQRNPGKRLNDMARSGTSRTMSAFCFANGFCPLALLNWTHRCLTFVTYHFGVKGTYRELLIGEKTIRPWKGYCKGVKWELEKKSSLALNHLLLLGNSFFLWL